MNEAVDAAAEIAGEHAERRADQAGDRRRGDADQQRHARAVEQPAQIIATELVGAEHMQPAAFRMPHRRQQPARQILTVWIVRREQGCKESGNDDDGKQRRADRQALLAEQAAQRTAPRRYGGRLDAQRRQSLGMR